MTSANRYDDAAREMRRAAAERSDGVLDASELVRLATLAASSHNTQPWKFRVRRDVITILPDLSRRCPEVDPDDGHLFKSLGCAAENLVHAASAQGFAADVQFDPNRGEIAIELERSHALGATDLGRAITRRQCVRKAYDGKSLDTAALDQLERAARGQEVRPIMLTTTAQKEALTEYVSQGNTAQLTDPAFRKELISWIRFNPEDALAKGDGLSGRANGQPPLPTWLAKLIVGMVLTPKGQIDTDARNIRSSAGVAVFVARADDKRAWVEVGRTYERFALQATALDIRTAHVNQPIEVRALRPQLESWLKLNGEHALLAVRFGHGPTAPFSLRRPLDDVIVRE